MPQTESQTDQVILKSTDRHAAFIPPTTYRLPSDHRSQIGLGLTSTALRNHVGTRGDEVCFAVISFCLLLLLLGCQARTGATLMEGAAPGITGRS